jgi:hypothetical protein
VDPGGIAKPQLRPGSGRHVIFTFSRLVGSRMDLLDRLQDSPPDPLAGQPNSLKLSRMKGRGMPDLRVGRVGYAGISRFKGQDLFLAESKTPSSYQADTPASRPSAEISTPQISHFRY